MAEGCSGLTGGKQPQKEMVWAPTDIFLPHMQNEATTLVPWILAGQGKIEFPEAFDEFGIYTDVIPFLLSPGC